jgi:hypothetical protein
MIVSGRGRAVNPAQTTRFFGVREGILVSFSSERDPTPFNNQVTLKQSLIVVPSGALFPDG